MKQQDLRETISASTQLLIQPVIEACSVCLHFGFHTESAADSLKINTKRSTYRYNLPNTVNKSAAQAALIQYDTFNVDWSNQNPDNRIEPKVDI